MKKAARQRGTHRKHIPERPDELEKTERNQNLKISPTIFPSFDETMHNAKTSSVLYPLPLSISSPSITPMKSLGNLPTCIIVLGQRIKTHDLVFG
jgi:hypothetical protein